MTVQIQVGTLETCEECNGSIVRCDGSRVCEDCGLIIGRDIVRSSYQLTPQKQATSTPTQFVGLAKTDVHNNGLGSSVGYGLRKKSMGRTKFMTSKERMNGRRLKWTQMISERNEEMTLKRVLIRLSRNSDLLGISHQYRSQIVFLVKKALKIRRDMGLFSPTGYTITAACTEYISKTNGLNIEVKDIWAVYKTAAFNRKTSFNNCKLWLEKILGIKFLAVRPVELVGKVISQLKMCQAIDERLERHGVDKTKFFVELEGAVKTLFAHIGFEVYGGRNPYSVVASGAYALSRLIVRPIIMTQKIVESATGAAEYTIRDHCMKVWKPLFPRFIEEGIIEGRNF